MSAVRGSFGRKLRSADDVESFGLGLLAILTSFRRSLFLLLYDQRVATTAIVRLFLPKCLWIINSIHHFFPDGHVFCRFFFRRLNRSWGKVDRLEQPVMFSLIPNLCTSRYVLSPFFILDGTSLNMCDRFILQLESLGAAVISWAIITPRLQLIVTSAITSHTQSRKEATSLL